MANKKVIRYVQYALRLGVKSPLCVSGGADDVTDCDVQKDFDGRPFIPGTSLAGALRGYLEECAEDGNTQDIDALFGYSKQEKGNKEDKKEKEDKDGKKPKADKDGQGTIGTMSRVQISDLRFANGVELIIRDGIRLEHKLTVKGAKFDMEAIDTGAACEGFLLLIIREGDDGDRFMTLVEQALAGLMHGEIRLGANKNRGFGELTVLKAKKKIFTAQNIHDWLVFDRAAFLESDEDEFTPGNPDQSRYLTIRVPLKQKGGISIRRYSVVPGEPDYAHITSNDCPVIPGSSWNGAIRSRVAEILTQLKVDSPKAYIDEWFGYVREEESDAKQSDVIIGESVIEGGVDLSMTRTKINRYSASVVSGALYSEKSHFDGKLVLEIKVRKNYYDEKGEQTKDDRYQYEPIVGMLLIALKDIQNGYLAIGGQTAVGRGIFEGNGSIELIGTEEDENHYINAVSVLFAKEKNI